VKSVIALGAFAALLACSDGASSGVAIPAPWQAAGIDADAGASRDAHVAPDADASTQPPDVDLIPWQTGASVGYGVASKDTQNPLGNSMLVAYAGYAVDLASAEAWATALYRATLRARGVRHIWAVQGPADPSYSQQEIGNSKIASALIPLVNAETRFVLAAGHSSGSFVAHELLEQLAAGADPANVTNGKVVYFDLDGGGGITQAAIDRLRNAYFVGSHDGTTTSPNHADMMSLGSMFAAKGGFYDNDASTSGCDAGAEWCVHVTLINTKPHDPTTADPIADYSDFVSRPVCTSYIEAKASEAGL
jgi:hypothetical protein